jgi:peroxiredoxin
MNGRKLIMHARSLFFIVAMALLITGCNRMRNMGSREAAHELVGKASPVFTAPLLDGGELRLEDELGKNVIVLDFWATWCGPCVKALPTIASVTREYRDRGVRFFAVDQGEDADTIRSFLKERQLDVTVALDADGEIGNRYKVEGIPQTVIIGRDGKVKSVHIGLIPDLATELARELEGLVEKSEPVAHNAPPAQLR